MTPRYLAYFCAALGIWGIFFFVRVSNVSVVAPKNSGAASVAEAEPYLPPPPEAPETTSSGSDATHAFSVIAIAPSTTDAPDQPPLADPPRVMKGLYLTGWSAGTPKKVLSTIAMMKQTGLNTVVIDIKDYSGTLSYSTDIPLAESSGAFAQIKIRNPNAMIKEFHDEGIYVIGRVTDFQDPVLAKAHPEWALKNKTNGNVWTDNHGLAWMDPAATPVWDYLVRIAQDAHARGFDEIQFDYVRFASDGSLGNISFPYWDEKIPRTTIIANFFKYLREHTQGITISADLFGLSTINHDDLGIGQVIESAYKYFDYVSPMVYPSHYANGFLGYKNPAQYPYEVVSYSMSHALIRLEDRAVKMASSTASSAIPVAAMSLYRSKLRPWLQDFNLGATYNGTMVGKEIQAVNDTIGKSSASGYYGGWLLWDAANNYNGFQEMNK